MLCYDASSVKKIGNSWFCSSIKFFRFLHVQKNLAGDFNGSKISLLDWNGLKPSLNSWVKMFVVLKKSLFAPPKNKYLTVWTNISAILWKLQRRPVKSNLMCWKLLRFLSTNTSNSSYDNICWLMILSFL